MTSKKIIKVFVYILALIGLFTIFGDTINGLLLTILSFSILLGLVYLIKALFKPSKPTKKDIPTLSPEKEKHYHEIGMSDEQVKFFRETMAHTKKQIVALEKNMDSVAKLRAINLRNDTVKAAKGIFKELVKEPQKLHQANDFLYNHLPNLVDLTNKYIEINNHDVKNKNTYDALAKSADVIDQVSQLLVSDYARFVSDDLDALDIEMTVAEQNIARERLKQENEAVKNEEKEF